MVLQDDLQKINKLFSLLFVITLERQMNVLGGEKYRT